jgi:hypothetical protein
MYCHWYVMYQYSLLCSCCSIVYFYLYIVSSVALLSSSVCRALAPVPVTAQTLPVTTHPTTPPNHTLDPAYRPTSQSRIAPFLKKSARTSVPLGFRISRRLSIRIPDTILTSGSRPNRPSRSPVTLTSSNRTTTSPHNCSPHLLLHSWL